MSKINIASKIDLYNLQYEISEYDIQLLFKQAIDNGYRAIGVLPTFVAMVKDTSLNKIPVIAVLGLPEGKGKFDYWLKIAEQAILDGADEIEWVLDYKQLNNMELLIDNLREFTFKCHCKGVWTRLVIEIGNELFLDKIVRVIKETGFKGIMTSTGMIEKVATVENVKSLKTQLPKSIEIKAAGKIYNRGWADKLIKAGADRIATSRVI